MIHKGMVIDNQDPLFMGRLNVFIPGVFDKAIWCAYASPVGSYVGGGGMVAIPEINTEVLIAAASNSEDQFFEYLWFAAVYRQGNPADDDTFIPKGDQVYKETGLPRKYIWKSPGGHTIEMSDTQGEHYNESLIRLETAGGKVLIMDDTYQNPRISILNKSKNGFELTDQGELLKIASKTVHIISKGNDVLIQVNEGGGNVSIINNGKGDVSIETQSGDIQLKSGSGNIDIEGTEVNIKASNLKVTADRVDYL